MKETSGVKYSELSSVSWVNRYWVIAVFLLAAGLNLMAAIKDGKGVADENLPLFWPMFAIIIILCLVIIYPYYHYRIEGGYVKRIPPRFVSEKPVFVQMYE